MPDAESDKKRAQPPPQSVDGLSAQPDVLQNLDLQPPLSANFQSKPKDFLLETSDKLRVVDLPAYRSKPATTHTPGRELPDFLRTTSDKIKALFQKSEMLNPSDRNSTTGSGRPNAKRKDFLMETSDKLKAVDLPSRSRTANSKPSSEAGELDLQARIKGLFHTSDKIKALFQRSEMLNAPDENSTTGLGGPNAKRKDFLMETSDKLKAVDLPSRSRTANSKPSSETGELDLQARIKALFHTSDKIKALFQRSEMLNAPDEDEDEDEDPDEGSSGNDFRLAKRNKFQQSDLPNSRTSAQSDDLPDFLRVTSAGIKALFVTSDKIKQVFQKKKSAADELDAMFDFDDPELESFTAKVEQLQALTPPDSKLSEQEKMLMQELVLSKVPKSDRLRGDLSGEATKPKRKIFQKVFLLLATSGVVALVWLLAHPWLAQQFVKGGMEQLSKGAINAALTSFDRAIQVDGQNAGAYFNRGNAYRTKGDLEKAFADYSTSLQLVPSETVLDSRASLCLKLGNYQQAAYDYTSLVEVGSAETNPQLYNNRAQAYAGLGQYDKALEDYTLALKANSIDQTALAGSALSLLKLGQYDKAVSQYNLVTALDPHNSKTRLERGFCYQKQKKFAQAAKDFQTVLEQNPHDQEALLARAALYVDQGLSSQALADLSSVIQLNPASEQGLASRARLYTKSGAYAKAIQDYNQVLNIPHCQASLDLHLDRASLYSKLKDYEKEIADYTAVIGLAPKEYPYYLKRAQCYLQLKDYKKGIADCTTAAELSSKSADIYQERGTIWEQSGNPVSACKDYEKAISLDKNYIDPYLSMARYAMTKHDVTTADEDYIQVLKIDPENAAALAGRKQIVAAITPKSAQQGSDSDPIPMLTAAVSRNPNDSTAIRKLGYAYLSNNRPYEAIDQFEALRRLKALLPADHAAFEQACKAYQQQARH